MEINQTDIYPKLIDLGYSIDAAYYYANQAYNYWYDRTKID